MKRTYFLILLSIVSLSAFTQQISGLDKSVNKMMKQAESYIPRIFIANLSRHHILYSTS
jgi:hypothetical protein